MVSSSLAVFVRKQYAGRLVSADAQEACLCAAALVSVAIIRDFRVAEADAVCANPASVSLHDAAHFGIGEFLYVEQCSLHVSPF